MIFTDEELAQGLARLGKSKDARFLHQLLLKTVVEVHSPALESGTAQAHLGRRIFASELIAKLKLDGASGGPDATELIRGNRNERPEPGRQHVRRRLPSNLGNL